MPRSKYPDKRCLTLKEDWKIQSSKSVTALGGEISSPGFKTEGWVPASVPTGVVAALVKNKVYPDPTFGMNLREIPGTNYPVGDNFFLLPTPEDSPFAAPWWFRKEFKIPKPVRGEHTFLHFDGINYKADIWLNGKKIADQSNVVGAYPRFTFDITPHVNSKKTNVLALEISVPTSQKILAFSWADWHPCPPDKNLGLWRNVTVTRCGPVALDDPKVISTLDLPSLDKARLTVTGALTNATDETVKGSLRGTIGKIRFSQEVELKARETRVVSFDPSRFPQLNLKKPRLWWPYQMGAQEMYDLKLEFVLQGKVSDRKETRFGIRQVTSELIQGEERVVLMDRKPVTPTKHHSDTGETGYRLFKVNGKPILIRGAGWAPDMLFNTTPEREAREVRYVRDMNLNAIRFEGSVVSQNVLDLCDEFGILVMCGWTCECHWERWADWAPEDYKIAEDSLRSEIRRLLNHPCVFVWLNGSDFFPPPEVLKMYSAVLEEEKWPNPSLGSARGYDTFQGKTGLKMRGPYQYEPPLYWYEDQDRGGASFGFNTETGCGPAVPPVESIKKMLPADHLWPPDEFWTYHCCGGAFSNLAVHDKGLEDRYGKAGSLEEYVLKAQVLAYDGHRAMFEAYGKFKYRYATGVIQWMLNNGWPSFYWHLYDYYLRPGSSYFATKKANAALHIQYSYEDRVVVVLNNLYLSFPKAMAKARVFDFNLKEMFYKQQQLDLGPDSSNRVFSIPGLNGLTSTYFIKLELADSKGKSLSDNFYWLSTQKELMNYEKPEWCYTPTLKDADMRMLNQLPKAPLAVKSTHGRKGKEGVSSVSVKNTGKHLAFFIRLKLVGKKDGEEALPVLWEDNYFSLLPGETKRVKAIYPLKELNGKPVVEVEGWNVEKK